MKRKQTVKPTMIIRMNAARNDIVFPSEKRRVDIPGMTADRNKLAEYVVAAMQRHGYFSKTRAV